MRTVLNEKQLLTLRTCYSANPRPDALMKEHLVEMTQLSPRVIRVWFQNKRTRDDEIVLFIHFKFAFSARLQRQKEKYSRQTKSRTTKSLIQSQS